MHALCDALFGAAGLGDIGEWFPNDDPIYKDASGSSLLAVVQKEIHATWHVTNIDINIILEEPKLKDAKTKMGNIIAKILEIDNSAVNVKAKTSEGLGDIGAGNAVAAQVIVSLERK